MMEWRTPPDRRKIASLVAGMKGLALSVKTVLLCERRILLLREPEGRWELPGGRVEPGEDILTCLSREVEEETGLSVRIGGLVDYWVRRKDDGSRRLVVTLFSEADCVADPSCVSLSDEHVACQFLVPGDAPPMPMLEGYGKSLSLAFTLLGARPG